MAKKKKTKKEKKPKYEVLKPLTLVEIEKEACDDG